MVFQETYATYFDRAYAIFSLIQLTHWGRVTHICFSKLTIIGSVNTWTAPSHYLNQCWNIVNWTLRNKLQWNYSLNSNIFFQKNALENVVCIIVSISSRPQWVKQLPTFYSKSGFSSQSQIMPLQGCHMSAMASEINSYSTVCPTAGSD